jgi:glycosyltransferase involved in cell wall biosynthesis
LSQPARDRRVLVVLHEEELGGASVSVLRCVPGLVERGWSFSFWAPRSGGLFERLEAKGLDVYGADRPIAYSLAAARLAPGVAARIRRAPGYLRAFRRTLREISPELVHANSHATLFEAAVAHRAGIPTVFHVHEMFGEGFKWAAGRRLAFRVADEVIAVSGASAGAVSRPDRRARVVTNGVPIPAEPTPIRNGGALTVGTAGVISRRKGSDLFVEAARLARERRPELRFELVGSSTAEPLDAAFAREVLADARRADVEHREHADLGERLRAWDVFALPARRDPFPLSMLEAMAAGLPAIGADVDGIAEQLTAQSGVLVAPGDPGALAAAIVELADSPQRRAALGAAARSRAAGEYSLGRQVEGLDLAYREAIGSRSRRGR